MLELPLHLKVGVEVLENVAQVYECGSRCLETLDSPPYIIRSFVRSRLSGEFAGAQKIAQREQEEWDTGRPPLLGVQSLPLDFGCR
jgi:hypothetical protein